MGRKKIVIKRLAEDRNRNVTFLKRKAGLMKKAWELSVLCGAEVSVIVFNSAGKLFEFSSASSVELAIDRYHSYAGPVERRKPEEFIAQQAAGGADNSDDDEDVQPVPSGSGAAAGGLNNGGAPITASGNMSLRGRDEWKEATVPSYSHLQGGIDDDRTDGGMPHGSGMDGVNMSGMGPVDPRLTERQPFSGGHQSSFNHHHHQAEQQQDHPSFRLSRESEEIMEQQRRAEQYRFLQMQAQMNSGGIASGSPYGGVNDASGMSAPSWMGMGRNRQRSDLLDGGLDVARGGGEQLTSWAAMRGGGARTPSMSSNAAFPQSGPGGRQPSLNSLYAQRLDAHSAQGTTSPTRASMASHGPGGGGGGSESMSRGGISPASRHGLPAENISAGEFTGGGGNPGGGLDFYTSYHLPQEQGVNADGTLDWQRTAAAAQLQAALHAQQAQLAYLRQQKAQQVQWQDLVAASGMDNAVHQLHSRLTNNHQQQQEHGGDSRGAVGVDYAGRYTPRGEQNTAPSSASFQWPTAGGGSTNETTTAGTQAAGGGSWYNTLQDTSSTLRTSDLRLPHPPSEDVGRGPSVDQRGRATVSSDRLQQHDGKAMAREYDGQPLSYAIENEARSPGGGGAGGSQEDDPSLDLQQQQPDGRKRRMENGEDGDASKLDGRGEGDARKRGKVASS
ncbi:hypothetical protein QFC22_002989 [Naganishia vaughanmartiniae]|uniref:Uncharacterized protein n=1 Tax=Naganishia vaughanmartiniae TaxID=1424756 RepID=A0ACC2X9K3_9TREE|nr:hypothetical protein QFC22_002989 [Naganishia vaughanmartiniae]